MPDLFGVPKSGRTQKLAVFETGSSLLVSRLDTSLLWLVGSVAQWFSAPPLCFGGTSDAYISSKANLCMYTHLPVVPVLFYPCFYQEHVKQIHKEVQQLVGVLRREGILR